MDAARTLFCDGGYFSTKVEDIAALARVAPATVYAVPGGKQGLLHGDVKHLMATTAPHEQAVAETFAVALARYRQALLPIAQRLLDLDALHAGMDVTEAVDVLWFYFGHSNFFSLRDENGWSYERVEHWLFRQASQALLRNPVVSS